MPDPTSPVPMRPLFCRLDPLPRECPAPTWRRPAACTFPSLCECPLFGEALAGHPVRYTLDTPIMPPVTDWRSMSRWVCLLSATSSLSVPLHVPAAWRAGAQVCRRSDAIGGSPLNTSPGDCRSRTVFSDWSERHAVSDDGHSGHVLFPVLPLDSLPLSLRLIFLAFFKPPYTFLHFHHLGVTLTGAPLGAHFALPLSRSLGIMYLLVEVGSKGQTYLWPQYLSPPPHPLSLLSPKWEKSQWHENTDLQG